MAYAMTKRGSLDNCVTYEFICDTVADMNAIEDRYRTIGSTAVVLQGDAGLEVYISGSDKIWTSLSVINSSGSVPSGGGLSFHICGQDELDANGLPDVSEPDEVTFYLVPAADETTGNIYDEYIYVDDEWEKFGSGTTNIDLSAYAPKANPAFTGSVSLDRYTGSTVGDFSVSLGRQTKATGDYSFAEGNYTTASGSGSHAEGQSSVASGYNSHAEGLQTKARGQYSHAEGQHTTANNTITYNNTTYYYGASGDSSHSEGRDTIAHGDYSHAEGEATKALHTHAHAEGAGTTASGPQSHAEGAGTTASGPQSHTEGSGTTASGRQSHAEGSGTTAAGAQSHTEGASTRASGSQSHAEGLATTASGDISHAEGLGTVASGVQSHAEGVNTTASGDGSHAEGGSAKALGNNSHAEGSNTTAYGLGAHAEGGASATYNSYAHAEGNGEAYGLDSHAEGSGSMAMWQAAHAEGILTTASGLQSHAEGNYTIAIGSAQHVSGLYNVADSAPAWAASTSYDVGDLVSKEMVFTDASNTQRTRTAIYKCITANSDSEFDILKWRESGIYAEIIGNGTADNARSNARTLDWNGNEHLMGDLYVGCNADSTGGTKVAKISDIPDVQINGTSIVSNGVANIPQAENNSIGVVKPYAAYGVGITAEGNLYANKADDSQLKAGTNQYRPIVPSIQHVATFYGLSKAAGVDLANETVTLGTYPAAAKAAIKSMIGVNVDDVQINGTSIVNNGIANIPIDYTQGIGINGGYLAVSAAPESEVKQAGTTRRPIVPSIQHASAFYGLAKAAGDATQAASSNAVGTYTSEAKAAIQSMLGVPGDVQVNGTSVVSNGVANIPIASVGGFGVTSLESNGGLETSTAGALRIAPGVLADVKAGADYRKPIVPVHQHEAVFYGLAKAAGQDMAQSNNAVGTYTSEAKAAIKSMIGVNVDDVQINNTSIVSNGVANIPVASSVGDYGVVKINGSLGVGITEDMLYVVSANNTFIKAGANEYRPIVPARQHMSVFYGLAKVAGYDDEKYSELALGTYSANAKSAISDMLNAPETVSGTAVSITAKSGIRYECGEVVTLTITLPATGDCEFIFESGSTPTVLTITPPTGVTAVKWPEWFDPEDLEADTTYDIIITNGRYGVVTSWA